jgi:transcriptional regulator with XRE-family HTH domain
MSVACNDDLEMNLVRLGIAVRALRRRHGWRQADLAARSGLSQQSVSEIERGQGRRASLARLERVAEALGTDIDVVVRWRGGALDRLLDERHASLCASVARRLTGLGWDVRVEVYAHYGERGSIDVVGWLPASSTIVVVEVKTELTSVEATLRKHDEKLRLATHIARDRFGVPARVVSGLLVLPDDATSRRRVARFRPVLGAAYPVTGRAAWRELSPRAGPLRPPEALPFFQTPPEAVVHRDLSVACAVLRPERTPCERDDGGLFLWSGQPRRC